MDKPEVVRRGVARRFGVAETPIPGHAFFGVTDGGHKLPMMMFPL